MTSRRQTDIRGQDQQCQVGLFVFSLMERCENFYFMYFYPLFSFKHDKEMQQQNVKSVSSVVCGLVAFSCVAFKWQHPTKH